ncbi:unnamed protein product [marine sediment metagenome]|uniref:Uncharacterized protein n=1 Tax=marine sediment metagenome TaxID=412755 RepID=X1ENV8_9ZZZZ
MAAAATKMRISHYGTTGAGGAEELGFKSRLSPFELIKEKHGFN